MQAVRYEKFGDESVLSVQEIPVLKPVVGQVQVRVRMASLNPLDFKLREGMLRRVGKPKRPATIGKDFVGEITALGPGVQGYTLGQRVFGSIDPLSEHGSCAQFIVVSVDRIAPISNALSDEVAASLPVASGTALQALVDIANLRRGQSILVIGASGAVGASAVQIGRSIGAHITGVCSSMEIEYVRSIGAECVIDYKIDDWRQHSERFDVILNAATTASFSEARPLLTADGIYINIHPSPALYWAKFVAHVTSRQRCVPFLLKINPVLLARVAQLTAEGVIAPRIHEVLDFCQVGSAQHRMQEGKVHGKVCVRPPS